MSAPSPPGFGVPVLPRRWFPTHREAAGLRNEFLSFHYELTLVTVFHTGVMSVSNSVTNAQVLLELLQVGGVVQFNEERLLALAEKAKLWVANRMEFNEVFHKMENVHCYIVKVQREGSVRFFLIIQSIWIKLCGLVLQLPNLWISVWEETSLWQDHWLLPQGPPQKGRGLFEKKKKHIS